MTRPNFKHCIVLLGLVALAACGPSSAGPGNGLADAAGADLNAPLDSAGGDIPDATPETTLSDLVDVTDTVPDTADAPAGDAPTDLATDVPLPTDVSPCDQILPVTTIGTAGPIPDPCASATCAACPAPYACTCPGDGATPCAWAAMAPLNVPRFAHAAVWGDDKLYVYGGTNAENGPQLPVLDPSQPGILTSAEVWDPSKDKWTLLPQAPVYPSQFPRIVWGDGKLYVVGDRTYTGKPFVKLPWGPDHPDYAAFDPKTGKWTSLPSEGSPGACGSWAKLAWLSGKLHVVGCLDLDIGEVGASSKGGPAAAYDPLSNTWAPLPPVPDPGEVYLKGSLGAVTVGNRWVFWAPSYKTGFQFDAAAQAWTTFGPPDCAPTLIDYRRIAIPGGVLYWGTSKPQTASHEAWIRWLDKNEWETVEVPDWIKPHDRGIAWTGKYVVIWDEGLFQGGLYDPVAHVWKPLPKLGQPTMRDGEAILGRDGQVFVVGGYVFTADAGYASTSTGRLLVGE